ncbi:MAG: tetratricopeptide repeat protein [Quinella sp. 3Q1]|nr:tetratricopeptide repeat protein [Quinella sp. 3Q1]
MSDAPNAIENFSKAIELNPNLAQAYFARGKCYQFVGNMAQAQADLSKAAALGFRG